MTGRMKIRAVSYLTALFIVLCGAIGVQSRRAQRAEYLLEASYQRALGNLHSGMVQLASALNKGQYVTSHELMDALAGEIFAKSAQVSSAIGELPYRDGNILKTAKFIAQVGDYAYALESGEDIGRIGQTFAALSQTAEELLPDTERLYAEMSFEDENLPAAENFSVTMERVEQEFPEYPTLVYDGPFSEHLQDRNAEKLSGKAEITGLQARKVAAEFLGVRFDQTICSAVSGGNIPVYTVHSGDASVDITKQGGMVKLLLSRRAVGNAKINDEQAIEIARTFLAGHGYTDLRESYHTRYENTVMIDFHATQDGVRLYPDLIKITVALDDGSIVSLENTGYLMHNKVRSFPEIKVPKEQIISQVPKTLSVDEISLALIPTGGENEILTYEVVCENDDGEHILLYYDVRDGNQVKILILIEEESGTLVM